MNLSSLSIKRPVATIMLTLMVVVVGIYSMLSIPKDLMPEIEMPVALVMTTYGGASPAEVETMVTEPVEQALNRNAAAAVAAARQILFIARSSFLMRRVNAWTRRKRRAECPCRRRE